MLHGNTKCMNLKFVLMISANGINLFGHVYSVVHYVSRSLRALGKGSSTFHFWFFILGDNFQFSLRQLVCYSWLLKMWYELVLLKCILVVTVSVGTLQLLEKKSSSRSSIYHYKFFILRGRGWLKGTAVPFFHIIRNASVMFLPSFTVCIMTFYQVFTPQKILSHFKNHFMLY